MEPWVLVSGEPDEDDRIAAAARELKTRYFQRYIEAWRAFLTSIRVEASGGPSALRVLQELTRGEPPPITRVLQAVAYNASLGGLAGKVEVAGEGLLERLRRRVGTTAVGASASAALATAASGKGVGPREVEAAFAGLVGFAVPRPPPPGAAPPAKQSLPADVYHEQLAFIRDALQTTLDGAPPGPLLDRVQAARTRVRTLIDSQEVGSRPWLEAVLWPPIEAASRTSAREAATGAAMEWCATVAKPFRRTLAGRYPFNREGDDASIADVSEFFKPGAGILWGFYEQQLRSEVQRAGDGFRFARQLGGVSGFRSDLLTFLSRADDVTQVLFPSGAAEPLVQFSLRIRPTVGVAVVWFEVDGQRFDFRNGPDEWHRATWPGQGKSSGAVLRVRTADGREEVLQQEGEWGLFRLLEAGRLVGEPGLRDFAVGWTMRSLGSTVTIDFRSARSDAPFFGARRRGGARFLGPLRAGVAPPLNIGKTGDGCG